MTGFVFFLVICGYLFYSLVWIVRYMQLKKLFPLVVFLVLSLFAGVTFFYLFMPLGSENKEIKITIPPKATVGMVADSLKKYDVITSVKALQIWLKITGLERKIQAGVVTLQKAEGVISASKKLLKAKSVDIALTVPEGLTIEQTATRISQTIKIDTSEFIRLCYDTTFVRDLGIGAISLEGYLYPNTYRFQENVTVKDIIRRMVKQFEIAYESLKPDQAITQKFSRHEIVTIASIVEKEAAVANEQGRIAGVFHNRLRIGYPLGADPTVRYAIKKFNGPLRVSELNNPSPYNTRRFAGLPPGPICSPGMGALQAAIFPDKTKDLYFVAKWDGSGEHDFSVTNEEHTRKKLMIRRQNEKRLKSKGD